MFQNIKTTALASVVAAITACSSTLPPPSKNVTTQFLIENFDETCMQSILDGKPIRLAFSNRSNFSRIEHRSPGPRAVAFEGPNVTGVVQTFSTPKGVSRSCAVYANIADLDVFIESTDKYLQDAFPNAKKTRNTSAQYTEWASPITTEQEVKVLANLVKRSVDGFIAQPEGNARIMMYLNDR